MAPGHLTGHEGYERVAHGTGYVLQDRQDDDKMGHPKGNWKEGGKMIDSPCLGSRNCTHGRGKTACNDLDGIRVQFPVIIISIVVHI